MLSRIRMSAKIQGVVQDEELKDVLVVREQEIYEEVGTASVSDPKCQPSSAFGNGHQEAPDWLDPQASVRSSPAPNIHNKLPVLPTLSISILHVREYSFVIMVVAPEIDGSGQNMKE